METIKDIILNDKNALKTAQELIDRGEAPIAVAGHGKSEWQTKVIMAYLYLLGKNSNKY